MNIIKNYTPVSVITLASLYFLMFLWWITIYVRSLVDVQETYYFGVALGLFAIICGVAGLYKSKKWGHYSSHIGRFLIFLSLGFITWGIGTLMIGYYNLFLDQSYPYPSLADVAYIASWPLWFIGMFNLSKATGAMFQIRKPMGKLLAFLIIISSFVVSYYLLFVIARGGFFEIDNERYLRLFFDFAYPVGDVVIITSSLLLFGLSFNYLGGRFKIPILIVIFGFLLNYTADVIFTYTNTIETFFVASWVDMLYVTVFLLLGVGVNLFDKKLLGINNE